jgi:hypothetical protein
MEFRRLGFPAIEGKQVRVQTVVGRSIVDAIYDSIELARTFWCEVVLEHDSEPYVIAPDSVVEKVYAQWEQHQRATRAHSDGSIPRDDTIETDSTSASKSGTSQTGT